MSYLLNTFVTHNSPSQNSETSENLLKNIEDVGVLLARSLCSIAGESVNDTIERDNIGKPL